MITLLLKASIVLAIMLAFYKIFLEKESFFTTNRIYLLACLLLTFILPFVSLPKLVEEQGYISTFIESTDHGQSSAAKADIIHVENTESITNLPITDPVVPKYGLMDLVLWVYFFGVTVFSLNLIIQISRLLLKVIKCDDKIHDTTGIIISTAVVQEPCSFFNYIFINPESYDYDTFEQIVTHEEIHVKKLHTIDLLLTEIAVIVLWFNPLIWILRKEVEKNIEYQTDDLLVNGHAVEKEGYQMNLLKIATINKPLTITTNYNQSLIKQRIIKMNAKKSNPQSYWKYAFVAPILFAMPLVMNKPFSALAQNDTKVARLIEENTEAWPYAIDCKELLRAVKAKDEAKVRELLKTVDPDCSFDGDGEPRSPLVTAARNGDLVIGKLLVDAGANVEFHARGDETPLMAASANGRLDFVKYLMAKGAELNKKLVGDGTALLVASREGHIETVKYLISQGAEIDGQVDGDGTALIASVRNGHYDIAQILLENGADPYLTSPGDEYAMHHAVMSKDKEMIRLLKKYEKNN